MDHATRTILPIHGDEWMMPLEAIRSTVHFVVFLFFPGWAWQNVKVLSYFVGFLIATILIVGPNFTFFAGGCNDFCAQRDAKVPKNSSAPAKPSIYIFKSARPGNLGRSG